MSYPIYATNTPVNNYMNGYNPYNMQMQMQQNMMQQPIQRQETINQQNLLQGKSVDSIEVVKAMDIPLDGSISYFPIANGSAIVTKQLQNDGTSKIIIYKPTELKEEAKQDIKYVTSEELETKIKDFNNGAIKEDIKTIKKQIRDILKEIEDINEDRKD